MKKKDVSSFDLALNYLSYRSRTEAEMQRYLEKKGMDEDSITDVIDKLKFYHYIDDEKYIQVALNQNMQCNMYGRQRLIRDLIQRGIKKSDLVHLDRFYTEKMERSCLNIQFEKVSHRYEGEPVLKQKQKIIASLQRKGFSLAMITTLMAAHSFSEAEKTKDEDSGLHQLNHYYEKYHRMYRQKGYQGKELENRIIRGLRSRGFAYDSIREVISIHENDEDEE